MQTLQLIIIILQSINIFFTLIFFTLFTYHLCKISSMGTTNKYMDKNWLIRIILAILYIVLSAIMLTIQLMQYINITNWLKQLLMSGSIGFCINSLVLILHIIAISKQLQKQLPFTKLHIIFLIYLVFATFIRLILVCYQYTQQQQYINYKIAQVCIAVLLVILSMIMISYWIYKRKTLPIFDDLSKVDINTITQRIINAGIQPNSIYTYMNNSSNSKNNNDNKSINLIIPNITVQLGKVHIILELSVDDQILISLTQTQQNYSNTNRYSNNRLYNKQQQNVPKTQYNSLDNSPIKRNKSKNNQHLQIISDYHYSIKQIKDIYLTCSRFDIQSHIKFTDISMADLYRQVKKFIQQLFNIKQAYINQIYDLFHIDNQTKQQLTRCIYKMLKNQQKQLMVSNYVDLNSMFISIEIYKQLWVQDHYIFYMQAISMQQVNRQVSVSYKRYSDFQQFHNKLQQLVNIQHRSMYKLPNLPKKHFFSLSANDTSRITQRRKQLQNYCQQTFNDYFIMSKMPRSRQYILTFLHLKRTFDIIPISKKIQQFYDGLTIKNGNIYKALVEEQYVTFYQFGLYRNGILLRNIMKRFRQFIALHQSIQRWMQNSQILYKFIVLPQKHLYKSETKRHQKLVNYLQNIITIKDMYKIYAINKFFNLGYHHDQEDSAFGMSIIKKQSSDCSESDANIQQKKQRKRIRKHQQSQTKSKNKIDNQKQNEEQFSMQSDRQRMSLMIEQLGD